MNRDPDRDPLREPSPAPLPRAPVRDGERYEMRNLGFPLPEEQALAHAISFDPDRDPFRIPSSAPLAHAVMRDGERYEMLNKDPTMPSSYGSASYGPMPPPEQESGQLSSQLSPAQIAELKAQALRDQFVPTQMGTDRRLPTFSETYNPDAINPGDYVTAKPPQMPTMLPPAKPAQPSPVFSDATNARIAAANAAASQPAGSNMSKMPPREPVSSPGTPYYVAAPPDAPTKVDVKAVRAAAKQVLAKTKGGKYDGSAAELDKESAKLAGLSGKTADDSTSSGVPMVNAGLHKYTKDSSDIGAGASANEMATGPRKELSDPFARFLADMKRTVSGEHLTPTTYTKAAPAVAAKK